MDLKRFKDRFVNYKGEPQQDAGIEILYNKILKSNAADDILSDTSDWATKFSEKELYVGPKTKPQDYNPKGEWFHLIVNDATENITAYDSKGNQLWSYPALARGQGNDRQWKETRSDTPPGLYKCGQIYRDYDQVGPTPSYTKDLMAYGWYSVDLIDLEKQESRYGRGGIMIHGGGSACGWPGAWEPKQTLYATFGCVRVHNFVLRDKIVPLCDRGEVYVSVYQEA